MPHFPVCVSVLAPALAPLTFPASRTTCVNEAIVVVQIHHHLTLSGLLFEHTASAVTPRPNRYGVNHGGHLSPLFFSGWRKNILTTLRFFVALLCGVRSSRSLPVLPPHPLVCVMETKVFSRLCVGTLPPFSTLSPAERRPGGGSLVVISRLMSSVCVFECRHMGHCASFCPAPLLP